MRSCIDETGNTVTESLIEGQITVVKYRSKRSLKHSTDYLLILLHLTPYIATAEEMAFGNFRNYVFGSEFRYQIRSVDLGTLYYC
jgi:hypothetical protein